MAYQVFIQLYKGIIRKKNTRSQCHVNLSTISKEINSLCRLLKLTIGLKVTAKSQVRPADITPGGSKLMKRKRNECFVGVFSLPSKDQLMVLVRVRQVILIDSALESASRCPSSNPSLYAVLPTLYFHNFHSPFLPSRV